MIATPRPTARESHLSKLQVLLIQKSKAFGIVSFKPTVIQAAMVPSTEKSKTGFVVFAEKTAFNKDLVTELEHWIDEYQDQLPPLKNFILAVNLIIIL